MKKNTKVILAVLAGVGALLGGGFWLLNRKDAEYMEACAEDCDAEDSVADVDEVED